MATIKTITANIPAKIVKFNGKTIKHDARVMMFEQNEKGQWSETDYGRMAEVEVIDFCKKASNWNEIRQAYFPMHGFHS